MQFSGQPIISVRVLFFGAVANVVGNRELAMELSDNVTVGDVHAGLLSEHPKLEGMRLKYAVNEQYCSGMHILSDGEDLAIFTAVSGG